MPGSIAALASAACWAFAVTIFRPAIRRYGADAVNFFKCLYSGLVLLLFLWLTGALQGSTGGMGAGEWATLGLASLCGMSLGDTCIFLAAARIGAQKTFLVGTLGPGLSALLGFVFFAETLSAAQVAGIVLTIAGVAYVILRETPDLPGEAPRSWGWTFAFLAMVLQSLGLVLNKPSLAVMDAGPNAMLRLFFALPFLWLAAAAAGRGRAVWRALQPGPEFRRLLVASTIGTVLGFWLYIYGVKHAKAGIAAAMSSTTPLFAVPAAWLLEGRRPGLHPLVGSLLAVSGAVLVTLP